MLPNLFRHNKSNELIVLCPREEFAEQDVNTPFKNNENFSFA